MWWTISWIALLRYHKSKASEEDKQHRKKFDSPAHSTSFMNNYTVFGQEFWMKSPSALLQTDFFSAL
jgi:hypothetical protein